MKNYADISFYINTYKPKENMMISAADFSFYARKATQIIKQYTGQNIDENNIPECVKFCCCEIAEILAESDKLSQNHGGKSSESVQGWSVSYESKEQTLQAMQTKIKGSVYSWLSGTGLLYRGI